MTDSRFESLPALRRRSTQPFFTTATPAESYPRYSRRRSPSMSTGTTSLGPMYPMIPHMICSPLRLQTSDFRLQTSDFTLQPSDFRPSHFLALLRFDPAFEIALLAGAD